MAAIYLPPSQLKQKKKKHKKSRQNPFFLSFFHRDFRTPPAALASAPLAGSRPATAHVSAPRPPARAPHPAAAALGGVSRGGQQGTRLPRAPHAFSRARSRPGRPITGAGGRARPGGQANPGRAAGEPRARRRGERGRPGRGRGGRRGRRGRRGSKNIVESIRTKKKKRGHVQAARSSEVSVGGCRRLSEILTGSRKGRGGELLPQRPGRRRTEPAETASRAFLACPSEPREIHRLRRCALRIAV